MNKTFELPEWWNDEDKIRDYMIIKEKAMNKAFELQLIKLRKIIRPKTNEQNVKKMTT